MVRVLRAGAGSSPGSGSRRVPKKTAFMGMGPLLFFPWEPSPFTPLTPMPRVDCHSSSWWTLTFKFDRATLAFNIVEA